jgi:UDP-N-acetylmuramate dehydrogenase
MMAAIDDMRVRGELRQHEPMHRHTSWRAGGPAEWFFKPADIEDLERFLANLEATTPALPREP